jgi:hypothetical protein
VLKTAFLGYQLPLTVDVRQATADMLSSGFGKTTEYADLAASKCTSCSVSQDKSAYWTPVLYFQDSAGKFHLVDQVGGMLA